MIKLIIGRNNRIFAIFKENNMWFYEETFHRFDIKTYKIEGNVMTIVES